MRNEKITLKKIVYFDEQAAMDLLLEKNDGVFEKTAQKAKELAASVEGDTKIQSPNLLERLFSFNLSGNAKGAASSIAQTQIKSTILTEFLNFAKSNPNFLFDEICSLEITDDSLAYIRSAGKYLRIFNPKVSGQLDPDLENVLSTVNIEDLDRILDQASGYYRMIGNYKQEQCIVRFNFEGIRNNYKLIDLPKMNLRIMGVKVGKTDNLDIGMESELTSFNNTNENVKYDNFQLYNHIDVIDNERGMSASLNHYNIIDALIAGVE